MAYANSKKNRNFSDYVNYRFKNDQGKVSLKIATRSFFIWIFFAAVFLISFISINKMDFLLEQDSCFRFLYLFRYVLLLIAGLLVGIAIWKAAPIFTSWKSEGKYKVDNSDIFELYSLIVKRLIKGKVDKVIIFVDDLDRIEDHKTIVLFLKELYRFVNLLEKEQANKLLFVVSLKPEEILKQEKGESTEKIYPKIFDYTLNIKPIHCETYYDIVKDLLEQKKSLILKLFNDSDDDNINLILKDLKWLYSDENLTIREIKERLNETFLLYQMLRARDYKSSSVQLNKAAAVTYLKRRHSKIYYKNAA